MLAGDAMPAAHYVHPEFGLLCPTPRLRRRLRIVFACMILAWIGGAVLRAVNTPPNANPSSANSLRTMTAAGGEESAHTSPDTGQAPAARLATRPSLPAVAETGAVDNACEQGSSLHRTWAYLKGKCVAGKARKPRAIHRYRPHRRAGARSQTGVLRAECADRFPGEPAQIGGGRARRDGGLDRAFGAAGRSIEKAAENRTQPSAPARAGGNRGRWVARGAHRRRGRAWLW